MARRDPLVRAVARLDRSVLECRAFGHAWSWSTAPTERGVTTVTLVCLRCPKTRHQPLRVRSGRLVRGGLRYNNPREFRLDVAGYTGAQIRDAAMIHLIRGGAP